MPTLQITTERSAEYGPGAAFKLRATEMVEVSPVPYALPRQSVKDIFDYFNANKLARVTTVVYELRSYGSVTVHSATVTLPTAKTIKIGCQRFGIRATARLKKWALALK